MKDAFSHSVYVMFDVALLGKTVSWVVYGIIDAYICLRLGECCFLGGQWVLFNEL